MRISCLYKAHIPHDTEPPANAAYCCFCVIVKKSPYQGLRHRAAPPHNFWRLQCCLLRVSTRRNIVFSKTNISWSSPCSSLISQAEKVFSVFPKRPQCLPGNGFLLSFLCSFSRIKHYWTLRRPCCGSHSDILAPSWAPPICILPSQGIYTLDIQMRGTPEWINDPSSNKSPHTYTFFSLSNKVPSDIPLCSF